MKLLEDKILAEGIAESENILKVDSFINHQVDPELMKKMGKDIAEHYKGKGITRIATIESSGIAPALMAAEALGVPLVILKKQPSKILNHDLYQTFVTSLIVLYLSRNLLFIHWCLNSKRHKSFLRYVLHNPPADRQI